MANSASSELADSNQREAFSAELDMALNYVKFATVASDPELARYVHGKARESYQRLAKWPGQTRSSSASSGALHTLRTRLDAFHSPAS